MLHSLPQMIIDDHTTDRNTACTGLDCQKPASQEAENHLVTAGETAVAKVRMSPSSTCKPGHVVSRSPLVPQLARVPPQLPLAEMVTVCAAAGAEANAASARTRAASAC